MRQYIIFETDIGPITILEEHQQLIEVAFGAISYPNAINESSSVLEMAKEQILEYFNHQRQSFSVPKTLKGTDFYKKVWQALETIAYGELKSYQDIAVQIGHPKAYRAVGMACKNNPLPILIPCHRVVGSHRQLVGFAGGLDLKRTLIEHEKSNPE